MSVMAVCAEISLANCYPRVIHTYILQVLLALYIMYVSSVRRFISASLDLGVANVFAHLLVIKIESSRLTIDCKLVGESIEN